MSVIPCITWVRRGVARQSPDQVQITREELAEIIKSTKGDIEDIEDENQQPDDMEESDTEDGAVGDKDGDKKKKSKKKRSHDIDDDELGDDVIAKYGLDDYDEASGDEDGNPLDVGGISFYASNRDDPHMTIKDDEDSDADDMEIQPNDNLIAVAKVKEDCCQLDVYLYSEQEGHLFVHHDILLPSFPLAMEWMNFDPGEATPGNFLAVSGMTPTIDIWDLDLINAIEPSFVLGQKVKKKSKKKGVIGGHTDAVLDLSWNHILRTALASASADYTVALWDLTKGTVATTITQHKDKVQAISWHPFEAQTLLSGGFDQTVKIFDCRNPDADHRSWDMPGEVERVAWNHFSPMYFLASSDSGHVYYMDVRSDKPVFTLKAHTDAVTGLTLSCRTPGLLVTTSEDKYFKVWDILSNSNPELVFSKDLKIGKIACVSNCPDAQYVFAAGGEKEMKVWDIRQNEAVKTHFKGRTWSPPAVGSDGGEAETSTSSTSHDTLDAMSTLSLEKAASSQSGDSLKKPKKKKKPKKQN